MNTDPIDVAEITGIWPYLNSIDWNEPWLQVVLGFHSCCMTLTYLTRKNQNVQIGLFLIYLAVVYFGEYINEKAAKHWRLYAKQQYFDSSGLFISIILLGPLLLNCLVMVGLWVYGSIDLLVKVKRLQLRQGAKSRETEQTASKNEDSQSENEVKSEEDSQSGGQEKEDSQSKGKAKEDSQSGGEAKEDNQSGGEAKEDSKSGGEAKEESQSEGEAKEDSQSESKANEENQSEAIEKTDSQSESKKDK